MTDNVRIVLIRLLDMPAHKNNFLAMSGWLK